MTEQGHSIDDPAMRQHIMNLRFDPAASALMGAAFAQTNKSQLAAALQRAAFRRRALHCAFSGRTRRRQVHSECATGPRRPCRRRVSAGRRRQPVDFLRTRRKTQQRRSLCSARCTSPECAATDAAACFHRCKGIQLHQGRAGAALSQHVRAATQERRFTDRQCFVDSRRQRRRCIWARARASSR